MSVYVLGNDRVLEWLIAFFESFRENNPHQIKNSTEVKK